MSYVMKCFDIANSVIQEATTQFGYGWTVDEESISLIKKRCDLIDTMMDDFDGSYFEIDVNEETLDITLSFSVSDISPLRPNDRRLQALLLSGTYVSFKTEAEDVIRVDIVVPGVWRR